MRGRRTSERRLLLTLWHLGGFATGVPLAAENTAYVAYPQETAIFTLPACLLEGSHSRTGVLYSLHYQIYYYIRMYSTETLIFCTPA